jgi:hypothetical protein
MSWHVLEPILLRAGLARDAPQLVAPLRQVAEADDLPARDRALAACVAALGGNGHAERFVRSLAEADDPAARRLALELLARLPAPDPTRMTGLRPLLRDRRLPLDDRLAAAVALARAAGPTSPATRQVLRDFAAGFGRVQFLDSLPALRQRFGPLKALDRYAAHLRRHLPLRCPRCRVKLRRPAMARHLWREHRLFLDAGRAHSPWRMLAQWLDDPADGVSHAYRQLLRHGLRDATALARLTAGAARRQAGLCPRCFAAVPRDPTGLSTEYRVHSTQSGRLSGHGFVMDVSERGVVPWLHAESPRGIVFDGREPGRGLTIHGWRWLGVGGPVLLAVLLALTLPPPIVFLGTVIALIVALEFGLILWMQRPPDLAQKAIDHAWRLLAPYVHPGGFLADDAGFVAGLARESLGRGDARAREKVLRRLVERTTTAVRTGQASLAHLAPLLQLQAADAGATGGDPVRVLADAVGPCFRGERPPAWADALLSEEALAGWTRGQRARLRVLLAACAFEAELGVWELHELSHAVHGLGRVFDPDDTDGLARLRLLWDLRPHRPWQRGGPAATVFELANYPMLGGQHLEVAPDLLLFQPLPAVGGPPDHLLVCGRGLILRDVLIHERPESLDVRPLPNSQGGGYGLHVGPHVVRFPDIPDAVVKRLDAWVGFFFDDFLPRVGDILARPAGSGLKSLLRQLTVKCPECGARVSTDRFIAAGGRRV